MVIRYASDRRRRAPVHRNSGQTMLELVAATTIIALALVPALKYMRQSLTNLGRIELHEQMANLCASLMEEELARTSATWNLDSRAGGLNSLGFPELRFSLFKSDRASDGGIPDALAVIQVTVWHDIDGGGDLDADEPKTVFHTKIAKVLAYEYEFSTH